MSHPPSLPPLGDELHHRLYITHKGKFEESKTQVKPAMDNLSPHHHPIHSSSSSSSSTLPRSSFLPLSPKPLQSQLTGVSRPPLTSSPRPTQQVKQQRPTQQQRWTEEKEDLTHPTHATLLSPPAASPSSPPPSSLYPVDSVVPYHLSPFSFIDRAIASPYSEEFIYLHPLSPYELTIVSHDRIDPSHYYTMSRSGVTHFYHTETSFTSLSQWEREYFLFKQIKAIRFFAQYTQWKAINTWKKGIRSAKMSHCRAVLERDLDLLNPHLRPALLQVKAKLHQASQWRVFIIADHTNHNNNKGSGAQAQGSRGVASSFSSSSSSPAPPSFPLTLPSFVSLQRAQQSWIRAQLMALSSACESIVYSACQAELMHFLVQNGFRSEEEGGGRKGKGDEPLDGTTTTSSSTSLLSISSPSLSSDLPRKVSHAEKAANRTKCRKLTKFIRLVDYLCIDSLITMMLERTKEALTVIQGSTKRSNNHAAPVLNTATSLSSSASPSSCLFSVELELSDASSGHSLLFHPSVAEYESEVVRMIEEGVISVMDHYPQLLYDPHFTHFTKTSLEDNKQQAVQAAPSSSSTSTSTALSSSASATASDVSCSSPGLSVSVLSAPSFRACVDEVRRALALAFSVAQSFTCTFHPYRDIFVRHELTDIVSTYSTASIPVYTKLIAQFQQEIAACSTMPTASYVGILCIDSARLKALFTPAPRTRLAELERLLPSVAREKVKSQLAHLKDAIVHLSAIPSTVSEFVSLQSFLQTLHAEAEAEDAAFTFLTELYSLMSAAQLRVAESEKANFDKLSTTRQQFKTSLLLCEGALNANTERFARELEAEEPQLRAAANTAADQLRQPQLSSIEMIPNMTHVIATLREQQHVLEGLEEKVSRYVHYQSVLQLEGSSGLSDELAVVRADCDIKLAVWSALQSWGEVTDHWIATRFDLIDVDEIASQVSSYQKVYLKAKRMLPDSGVVQRLKENIDEFADTLPVVSDLRSKFLQPHHWQQIEQVLGYAIHTQQHNNANVNTKETTNGNNGPTSDAKLSLPSPAADQSSGVVSVGVTPSSRPPSSSSTSSFSLGTLIDLNAMQYKAEIAVIANSAAQEAALQSTLDQVIATWASLQFNVVSYKEQKDVFILAGCEEVMAALDESLVAINSILSSRYVEPMREAVLEWNRRLLQVSECIEEWLAVQRQWLYLEVIFASGDIVRQLPEESSAFNKVDRAWKELMRRSNDQPNVLTATTINGLKDALHQHNVTLERVQKQLESYLETRRQAFPRFYFLSNDELLLILAQAKNPESVQPHLSKCFDAISRLEFTDHRDIRAMISGEGEKVQLSANLKARGPAEAWLPALETDMIKSLKRYIKRGVVDYAQSPRRDWILQHYAQVVAVGSMIAWARQAEQCIRGQTTMDEMEGGSQASQPRAVGGSGEASNSLHLLSSFFDIQVSQLNDLTELVRTPLTPLDRKKVISLIVTDVHNRDITAQLLEQKVSTTASFLWQQQLRFSWDVMEDDCLVQQANATFNYGYEYEGVTSRLVITPLTDRCWMTITGALQLRFGAAPQGPAGTGKTESTKDLAKALGQLCIVVNVNIANTHSQRRRCTSAAPDV